MIAVALTFVVASWPLPAWHPVPPETAAASLGFSGARLQIRSVDDPVRSGVAHRTLSLIQPSGRSRKLTLAEGGGRARNWVLNLYNLSEGKFLLVSERDCVAVDGIEGVLKRCVAATACRAKHTFIGSFNWTNAFDPPRAVSLWIQISPGI